ncbi:MAG TPA: hypothetical protein PL039_05185 [Kiritimatiellia bacterium]|nr:hypothetical protein [Lentisphaerota bacterium]HPC19580.1 hypothetical protein [Kiritimatiellia bacterium]
MIKWFWLILLPSVAFAQQPASINMRKDPVYIAVDSRGAVLYPEQHSFLSSDLDIPKSDFERLLDDIEKVTRVRYVVLLLSPESASLQRRLRIALQKHQIDLGLEPWDPGTKIDATKMNKHFIPLVPESYLFISTRLEHRLWHAWRAQRGDCEVRVYSNSVVFLTNNLAMSWEELQIPGNSFDQMLDRWEGGEDFPSVFCKESGSDDLYAWIMDRIYDRGAKMNEWTAAGTPIEVPANGRAPFYLECRGSQLFAIAADALAQGFEISELKSLDPAAQYVCFLVRPDGFEIFRQARKAAWEHGLDVSCELQDESGPFAIGSEGTPLFQTIP